MLRVILGPAPDSPEYADWWRNRLVSVRMMREAGRTVLWAEEPPVPISGEEPKKPIKEDKRKPAARKPRKAG